MNTRSKTDKTARGKPELPKYIQSAQRAFTAYGKPQAQHSPLPTAQELDQLEMAKEILVLRKHVEALAEALRDILFISRGAIDENNMGNIQRLAVEALANWEGAKHE